MSKEGIVSVKDIPLLFDLVEDIKKYQGVHVFFGIPNNFIELIESDSLNITVYPDGLVVNAKTCDYDFVIHKFDDVLKIEQHSKYFDKEIIRFVDADLNVRTNSTIVNYKNNNNLLSKTRSIRGKGYGTLLCDRDGNFISEEQFWDTYEDLDGSKTFKPYVRHEILRAIDNKIVLGKNKKSYYDKTIKSNVSYSKYIMCTDLNGNKELQVCGDLSEETYCDLMDDFLTSKKEEPKKTRRRIFKK